MSEVTDKEVTLTVDTRAAAVNDLADIIGKWADDKGFREDYDDADYLEYVVKHLNLNGLVAENLLRISESHRRLTNVSKLMLMVSELSEALEGMRDGGNYGEELGDVVIRVLENAEKNGIPIGDVILKKMRVNEDREFKHGRKF